MSEEIRVDQGNRDV